MGTDLTGAEGLPVSAQGLFVVGGPGRGAGAGGRGKGKGEGGDRDRATAGEEALADAIATNVTLAKLI